MIKRSEARGGETERNAPRSDAMRCNGAKPGEMHRDEVQCSAMKGNERKGQEKERKGKEGKGKEMKSNSAK